MCHDYHADEGAPWTLRQPASRRASADRRRNARPDRVSLR
jgi:hypothetical protein